MWTFRFYTIKLFRRLEFNVATFDVDNRFNECVSNDHYTFNHAEIMIRYYDCMRYLFSNFLFKDKCVDNQSKGSKAVTSYAAGVKYKAKADEEAKTGYIDCDANIIDSFNVFYNHYFIIKS